MTGHQDEMLSMLYTQAATEYGHRFGDPDTPARLTHLPLLERAYLLQRALALDEPLDARMIRGSAPVGGAPGKNEIRPT